MDSTILNQLNQILDKTKTGSIEWTTSDSKIFRFSKNIGEFTYQITFETKFANKNSSLVLHIEKYHPQVNLLYVTSTDNVKFGEVLTDLENHVLGKKQEDIDKEIENFLSQV